MSIFSGRQVSLQNAMPMGQENIAPPTPRRRGLFNFAPMSGSDRLMALGAMLTDVGNGSPETSMALMKQRREREQLQQRQQALQQLGTAIGGGGQAGQPGGAPSVRGAMPALLAASQAGVDIGDYVSLLDKAQPDVAFERGFRFDRRDPGTAPAFAPNLDNGQEPVYDANRRVVGVRNMDGAIVSAAQRERAVYDARNASQASYAGAISEATAAGQGRGGAPYQIETVQGPDGRPITTSRQNILQGGAIYGQSEADRAYGVQTAQNRATREATAQNRASAAQRMLPTLDRMEELLPNVIAGVGAEYRLGASRLGGQFGNEDAARRAAATEVFKNEARQIVAQIIGTFGANPTEGERKYAEQMAGADVNITPQALQEGIRLTRERAQRDIAAASGQPQAAPQGGPRPRARNPQTGQVVEFNGSQWVPVQ